MWCRSYDEGEVLGLRTINLPLPLLTGRRTLSITGVLVGVVIVVIVISGMVVVVGAIDQYLILTSCHG